MIPVSPGGISLVPVPPVSSNPPFLAGDSLNYVCDNPNVYVLMPISVGSLTECVNGGSFTLDASPPTCEQACKTVLMIYFIDCKSVLVRAKL